MIDWREIKYQIADKLFAYELDDAYRMGIRAGVTHATRRISFDLELKANAQHITKTQRIGYDKAVENMKDVRAQLKEETGAML